MSKVNNMSDKNEEIDNLLNELSDEKNEVENSEENSLENIDQEELARITLKMTYEDRALSNKVFEAFYPDLAMGSDKTTSSKENINRAVENKINAARNVIELMKVLKKNDNEAGNVGVFISDRKAGIDINNIKEDLD